VNRAFSLNYSQNPQLKFHERARPDHAEFVALAALMCVNSPAVSVRRFARRITSASSGVETN